MSSLTPRQKDGREALKSLSKASIHPSHREVHDLALLKFASKAANFSHTLLGLNAEFYS